MCWRTRPSNCATAMERSLSQITIGKSTRRTRRESAMFALLPPGSFTAILAGKDGGVGLGLLEIYCGLGPAKLTTRTTDDSGPGSLREMVAAANDGDTI